MRHQQDVQSHRDRDIQQAEANVWRGPSVGSVQVHVDGPERVQKHDGCKDGDPVRVVTAQYGRRQLPPKPKEEHGQGQAYHQQGQVNRGQDFPLPIGRFAYVVAHQRRVQPHIVDNQAESGEGKRQGQDAQVPWCQYIGIQWQQQERDRPCGQVTNDVGCRLSSQVEDIGPHGAACHGLPAGGRQWHFIGGWTNLGHQNLLAGLADIVPNPAASGC